MRKVDWLLVMAALASFTLKFLWVVGLLLLIIMVVRLIAVNVRKSQEGSLWQEWDDRKW